MGSTPSTRGVWLLALAVALLTAWTTTTTITSARDHYRSNFGDFSYLQTGSQCLLAGCDPYSADSLNALIEARHEPKPIVFAMSPVYPTSTLVILLPFTALSWPLAAYVFVGIGGSLTALAASWMVLRFRLRIWDPPVLVFVALLYSMPYRDAVSFGNPVILATALSAIAGLLLLQPGDVCSGPAQTFAWILLGLGLGLKPQLAIGPALVLFCRPETRAAGFKAGLTAIGLLVLGIASYRLRLGSFHFLESLRWALRLSVIPGGPADFANLEAYDFLNIQLTFARIPHLSRSGINALAWLITITLGSVTAWLATRTNALRNKPWTIIALALAISLLPVYHRGYDRSTALLLIPAATEIAASRKIAAWLYCALVAFWVASDTVMAYAVRRWRYLPQSPVEDVLFCILLLTSLLWVSRDRHPEGIAP